MPVRRASISQSLAVPLSTVCTGEDLGTGTVAATGAGAGEHVKCVGSSFRGEDVAVAGVRDARRLVIDVLAERHNRSDAGSSYVNNTVHLAGRCLVEVTTGLVSWCRHGQPAGMMDPPGPVQSLVPPVGFCA